MSTLETKDETIARLLETIKRLNEHSHDLEARVRNQRHEITRLGEELGRGKGPNMKPVPGSPRYVTRNKREVYANAKRYLKIRENGYCASKEHIGLVIDSKNGMNPLAHFRYWCAPEELDRVLDEEN